MSVFAGLIVATLVVAAADWWAVATGRRPVEYVLKPLTMVVLIAATLSLADPADPTARWLFVAALAFSLAGDVFLMLDERWFVAGLSSFLLGHLMYVPGLWLLGVSAVPLVLGVVLVCVAAPLVGVRVVRGAAARDPRLRLPVAAYITVISVMVASAFGTAVLAAIVGALLFYVSDAVIGWTRFVADLPHGRLIIMTTYHLGQVGLVLALAV